MATKQTESKFITEIVSVMSTMRGAAERLKQLHKRALEEGNTIKDICMALVKAGVYKNYNTANACYCRAIRLNDKPAKTKAAGEGDALERWLALGVKLVEKEGLSCTDLQDQLEEAISKIELKGDK